MNDLVVIFRTPSEIEASVIRGLLETHDIPAAVLSDNSRTAFPLALNQGSIYENQTATRARYFDVNNETVPAK